jgi:hypothetical protein
VGNENAPRVPGEERSGRGRPETTVQPLHSTIKGSAEGTSSEQAGIRGGPLPESGGVPPSALLTGGLALLLSSLVCLHLALRQAGANGS